MMFVQKSLEFDMPCRTLVYRPAAKHVEGRGGDECGQGQEHPAAVAGDDRSRHSPAEQSHHPALRIPAGVTLAMVPDPGDCCGRSSS